MLPKSSSDNEMKKYLESISDPSLTDPKAYADRQQQETLATEEEMKKLTMILHREMTKPPPQEQELRKGEQRDRDMEEKSAREKEAKEQEGQALNVPSGKKQGRMGMPMHQKAQTGMETKQNIKAG